MPNWRITEKREKNLKAKKTKEGDMRGKGGKKLDKLNKKRTKFDVRELPYECLRYTRAC